MNTAQLGWLGLDENFADTAERITLMPFFQTDCKGSKYTNNNRTSSAIRRIVVESIIISDFAEDYQSDFAKNCEYLSQEASDTNFSDFYLNVERLTKVCDESIADMFNAKDSFLWFGLFSRFDKLGLNDDMKFVEFLREFKESLHEKEIDGIRFDDFNGRGTKDKPLVLKKLNHLEKLLKEYLKEDINNKVETDEDTESVEEVETEEVIDVEENIDSIDTITIIKEYINPNVTSEDIQDYKDDLEILTSYVDGDSKLLDMNNRPSLLAMVAYGYKEDLSIEVQKWFVDYFNRNNMYTSNQRRNFQIMLEDFKKYNSEKDVA
jgi:hypothetical protein